MDQKDFKSGEPCVYTSDNGKERLGITSSINDDGIVEIRTHEGQSTTRPISELREPISHKETAVLHKAECDEDCGHKDECPVYPLLIIHLKMLELEEKIKEREVKENIVKPKTEA
jgi:hypothetical protein